MNDKEKLLMDWTRMCASYDAFCNECKILKIIDKKEDRESRTCQFWIMKYPKEAVEIIEKWASEHPVKTRQSEFLKLYPNARLDEENFITICPCELNNDMEHETCVHKSCPNCRKNYWSHEVTE